MKNRNTFESINIIKYPKIPNFQDSLIVAEKKTGWMLQFIISEVYRK